MLKNHFKVAWRSLQKHRTSSLINIVGLAAGMAITLVIGFFVMDEVTFDHYHSNYPRLAEVFLSQSSPEGTDVQPTVATPVEKGLQDQYGDAFAAMSLVSYPNDHIVSVGEKQISSSGVWAQWAFPTMFSLRMVAGSADAFKDISSALIARSMAKALFGTADPINQTIRLDGYLSLTIAGVYEDLPLNSSFSGITVVTPWDNPAYSWMNKITDWDNHGCRMFVQLKTGVNLARTSERIKNLPTPHISPTHEEILLQPFDKVHFVSEIKDGKPLDERLQLVWLVGTIGAFVLLLACINFMNLSTARSERRAKEVGIRKTVGTLRRQLIAQFLVESLLVAFLGGILSLLLVQVSLPFFNDLSGKDMFIPWSYPLFWGALIGFILLTGVLAGSYPAFYLSSFRPIKVLKGAFRMGKSAALPRQVLVVLQFTISLTLIIGTIVIFRQISYTKDRPIGYNREGLVTVPINTGDLTKNYKPLREDLLQTGLIVSMSESSSSTTGFLNNNGIGWKGMQPSDSSIMFRNVSVDPDFGQTVGWKVLQGRDFSRNFLSDSSAIILNEQAVKVIGIANPVGETIHFWGKPFVVIGVVGNMLTNSPYQSIEPAIFIEPGWLGVITLRLKPGVSMHKALSTMGSIFKKYNPGSPFFFHFNDLDYAAKFEMEQRIGDLSAIFAGLAIFISCLGLFGLASFMAEQRTKEIGVRKILGATLISLWGLLARDFVRLAFLSLLIAFPLAYVGMHLWLQNYPYRTSLDWWIFAAAGAGMVLVTLATVSYQSLGAAMRNPSKSLRMD